MDTISITAFAVETNGYKDPSNEFLEKAAEFATFKIWRLIASLVTPPKLQPLLNVQLVSQDLATFFENTIKTVIKQRRNSDQKGKDFVNLLLDAELTKDEEIAFVSQENNKHKLRKKLTDEEIIAQCLLFFVVGYETTSTLLQFTLYALAMNPSVQQTLFEEIRSCFDEHKTLEYETMMALPYFDAVVNESLRLYSPIPTFELVCGENYNLGDTGITIEKGTIINMPIYAMHHDEQLFPEPYQFKPERFLPENRDKIKPNSFLPFGIGPRMCVGMRFATLTSKLFLMDLVNQFEILKTKNTASEPKFNGTFVGLTSEPLLASFSRRN